MSSAAAEVDFPGILPSRLQCLQEELWHAQRTVAPFADRLRCLYPNPPEPVAGIHALSHHELAVSLGWQVYTCVLGTVDRTGYGCLCKVDLLDIKHPEDWVFGGDLFPAVFDYFASRWGVWTFLVRDGREEDTDADGVVQSACDRAIGWYLDEIHDEKTLRLAFPDFWPVLEDCLGAGGHGLQHALSVVADRHAGRAALWKLTVDLLRRKKKDIQKNLSAVLAERERIACLHWRIADEFLRAGKTDDLRSAQTTARGVVSMVEMVLPYFSDRPTDAEPTAQDAPPDNVKDCLTAGSGPGSDGEGARPNIEAAAYRSLAQWAADHLIGKQRRAVELLAAHDGRMRIADVASDPGIEWVLVKHGTRNRSARGYDDCVSSLIRELNKRKKLPSIGWGIGRHDNEIHVFRLAELSKPTPAARRTGGLPRKSKQPTPAARPAKTKRRPKQT